MHSFTFYSPTKVIFGTDAEEHLTDEIRSLGGSRVFVLYGGGSVVRSGLLQRLTQRLEAAGLAHQELGGVHPNPRLSFARSAVRQALDFGADLILAVGGGSVIDTAKAVALGAAAPERDIWEYWEGTATPSAVLPVGVVLTISAAGSETSDSAVLTNEETGIKRGLSSPLNRPRFALMNPELTYTLPPYQVACGVVDIMMHTLDRYFTPTRGNQLTDAFAEALLRTVIANGVTAFRDSHDAQAMSELMWCGSISHNGLTGLGAATDFSPHKLGHELSARFDVAHGASLSAVWGAWARYAWRSHPERFVRYAQNVWGISDTCAETAAPAAIEATEAYFRELNMPICFTELGVGFLEDAVLEDMADKATRGDTFIVGSFRPLHKADAVEVYRLANH